MALPSTLAALALDPGKPDVPKLEPIDLQTVLRDTIGANLGNFGDIRELTNKVNRLNTTQDIRTLERLFPGASNIIGQASGVIQSQLRGELPEDVQRQLQQFNAEAATAGGYGGSLFSGARTARDLGLTSLQIMNQGLNSAERWLAQSRSRVPLFNPASMFMTPAMGLQTAFQNQENQFNRDWMAEQVDKSLGMFEQSIMNSMQQMDQLILSGASMGMGMGMGGMGGGAMMGMMGGAGGGAGSGGGAGGGPMPGLGAPYGNVGGAPLYWQQAW